MKHNLVPLLEVGEHSDNIRVLNINLPGAPLEELRIDVNRTERIMKWGGIGILSIGSYYGTSTEYTSTGLTFNSDGSIGATGQKIAKKAEMAQHGSEVLGGIKGNGWRNTAVYFNSTATDEMRGDNPTTITKSLDSGFRQSLARDIVGHEVGIRNAKKEVLMASLLAGSSQLIDIMLPGRDGDHSFIVDTISWLQPKEFLPVFYMTANHMRKNRGIDSHGFKQKYSTMFDFHIDRTLLAGRHLAFHKLITYANRPE